MSSRVVIIGAGVSGLCSALYALRSGWEVTVVDRAGSARDGCSFGNAGMVVPSHFVPLAAPGMVRLGLRWMADPESPFYIQPRLDAALLTWAWRFWRAATHRHVRTRAPVLRDLSLLSRAEFEALAAAGLEFDWVPQGLLMLCRTAKALEEEAHTAEMARSLNLTAEVLDADAAARLNPGVTLDIAGAVHYPQDGHLNPARFMAELERVLLAGGVRFVHDAEVRDFRTTNDRVAALVTSQGEIDADEIVLSAGVWSDGLSRALDLRLPMQAGKGYSLTLPHPPQLPRLCAICTEARLAVTPMGTTLRVGGTMELAGLDSRINARRVRGLARGFCPYFPAFSESDFADIPPWSGLRPVSPDGMPYLGRTRRWANVIVATGHAMMGLSLGPATGKVVAALLDRRSPEVALTALDPDRYA
ncbi:MAG: FAD-dependent oxidoreductase [Verrucomicrobiales bacterium]|nr:FAD-dependent oxidoreductase [Verrucomicrobiales bacterium]